MLQLLKTLISSAQSSLPAYQEISLDGTTRYSTGPQSSAASARSQKARQVLINICTYSLPPLFLLWLFASPKGSTPDFIHGEPYACYGNGEMVLATTLEGYAKQLNHSTSPRNRVEIGLDRHLSYDQCDTFFPDQYQELQRAAAYWRSKGGISREDLERARKDSHATVVIQDNRLYVDEFNGGINSRTKASLAAINEAVITATDKIPDVEFSIMTSDSGDTNEEKALWVLSRTEGQQEYLWLMPDFGFNAWPEPGMGSFLEVQDQTLDYERQQSWSDKIPKLFWRGAFMVDIRRKLHEVSRRYAWGDVESINWGELKDDLRTPAEHCQYKYLAQVEGFAYSGRLKYLLQCRSVTVAHPMTFTQHFHPLINSDPNSPEQNMVITKSREWDDLPEAMSALIEDDAKAQRIANHSYRFWRYYLSSAAINCYWRQMFREWAALLDEPVSVPSQAPSYASFNLMGKTRWNPA